MSENTANEGQLTGKGEIKGKDGRKATKRIFVYEYLSGGGQMAGADGASVELMAMGQSMRDAITADLLALEDCQVSVATCSMASPVPQAATPVRPHDFETAFEFVARQADAHDAVWLVAPETDGLLAQFQHRIDPARWLGCDAASIALASSKRSTLTRLADAGLTTPLAFERAPEITRWVVKPDDGAGAMDTRLHASRDAAMNDAAQRARAGYSVVIEPWVEGTPMSLSMICSDTGCALLSINRQRLEVDADGRLSFCGVEVNALPLLETLPLLPALSPADAQAAAPGSVPQAAALHGLARRVAQAIPGLRGFVGIDLVWHAQRGPVVIEVNPRVTCAYVGLSHALGRNLATEVIAACGRTVPQ